MYSLHRNVPSGVCMDKLAVEMSTYKKQLYDTQNSIIRLGSCWAALFSLPLSKWNLFQIPILISGQCHNHIEQPLN